MNTIRISGYNYTCRKQLAVGILKLAKKEESDIMSGKEYDIWVGKILDVSKRGGRGDEQISASSEDVTPAC